MIKKVVLDFLLIFFTLIINKLEVSIVLIKVVTLLILLVTAIIRLLIIYKDYIKKKNEG